MKNRFKKILCPIDFDENSIVALEVACDLAQDADAIIYLLHVVVPIVPGVPQVGIPMEPFPISEHDAREKLERLAREHIDGQAQYKVLTHIGDTASTILNAVVELGVDSVVMATHGRKGLGRLLLGSVAEQVVRRATCPVLTVRPGAVSEKASAKVAEA
jgi:nucleotide-binding universal stress UspA family protein